jgi:hypothetical protein
MDLWTALFSAGLLLQKIVTSTGNGLAASRCSTAFYFLQESALPPFIIIKLQPALASTPLPGMLPARMLP